MNRLWRYALALSAAALTFVMLGAPQVIDDPPPGGGGGSDNVASTTSIFGSDTLKTDAIEALGAQSIIFAITATTGKDSAIAVLVSQDGSHYFTPALDGATSNVVKSGYASGDSLRNGPHTFVVTYVDSKSTIPWPYRYTKLKVYGSVGGWITGLRITPTSIYPFGGGGDYKNAYGYTW